LGEKYVNAFGGHAQACGFSIHKDDVEEWRELLLEEMNKLDEKQFDFSYKITENIKFYQVNHKLLVNIDTLAPYGQGFDYPVFELKSVQVGDSIRPFGNRMQKNKTPHVEFSIQDPKGDPKKKRFLRATAFGLWERLQGYIQEDPQKNIDLIFTLDYPHRRKSSKKPFPHLMVLDIKESN